MILDYDLQKTYQKSLDIVDLGNTVLVCENNRNELYYIIIRTELGKTALFKIGPVFPDLEALLDGFNVSFKRVDYKEKTIEKDLMLFINDPKKGIEKVEEYLPEEILPQLPDLAHITLF